MCMTTGLPCDVQLLLVGPAILGGHVDNWRMTHLFGYPLFTLCFLLPFVRVCAQARSGPMSMCTMTIVTS